MTDINEGGSVSWEEFGCISWKWKW